MRSRTTQMPKSSAILRLSGIINPAAVDRLKRQKPEPIDAALPGRYCCHDTQRHHRLRLLSRRAKVIFRRRQSTRRHTLET